MVKEIDQYVWHTHHENKLGSTLMPTKDLYCILIINGFEAILQIFGGVVFEVLEVEKG